MERDVGCWVRTRCRWLLRPLPLSWSLGEARVGYQSGFIVLREVEHVPASHRTNWAIWGQWERLEASMEVEFRFCWSGDMGWTHG